MTDHYSPHHVAITVRSIESTRRFYERFGFRLVASWQAADCSLRIAHFAQAGGFVLEAFEYAENHASPPLRAGIGNDLETMGVKHLGLRVTDLEQAHRALRTEGYPELTAITRGRTQIDYFFVRDPDGIWLEVVQDDRVLDPDQPLALREPSR